MQKKYMYTNKEIWNVSYPIFLGLLAQNIINVTDTAFLGRVGEVELGASAMGGLFYICVFTIAFGFSVAALINNSFFIYYLIFCLRAQR
jgi:Na+-driven multidrug efflux pump